MKIIASFFTLFISINCIAGTGHSKDMDITYLLVLALIGIILLIWNSIDYLTKNKEKIKSRLITAIDKIKELFRHLIKWDFLNSMN